MQVQAQFQAGIGGANCADAFSNVKRGGNADGIGQGQFIGGRLHSGLDDLHQPRQRYFALERTAKGGTDGQARRDPPLGRLLHIGP